MNTYGVYNDTSHRVRGVWSADLLVLVRDCLVVYKHSQDLRHYRWLH